MSEYIIETKNDTVRVTGVHAFEHGSNGDLRVLNADNKVFRAFAAGQWLTYTKVEPKPTPVYHETYPRWWVHVDTLTAIQ